MKVAALILAAGQSRRMGTNKLLLPVDGQPMIRKVAATVLESRSQGVTVVTGFQAEKVAAALEGLPLTLVHCHDHAEGMSRSLRAGLAALPADADGVLVCLGDMPFLRSQDIDRLIAAFGGPETVCLPVHEGQRGNPVLWGRAFFTEMAALSGDSGARALLARHPDALRPVGIDHPGILQDCDTPDSLEPGSTGEKSPPVAPRAANS